MFNAEDFRACFDSEVAGAEAATITGAADYVYGHFDDGYAEVNDTEGDRPAFTCMTADLPGGLVAGQYVIRPMLSKVYAIYNIRSDGLGVTTLDLEYLSG